MSKNSPKATPHAKAVPATKPSGDPHGFAPNPETTKVLRELSAPDSDQAKMNKEGQELIRSLGTQLEASALTGISQGHISVLVNGGQNITIESLSRLREAVGSDPNTKTKMKINRAIDSIYDQEHKRAITDLVILASGSKALAQEILSYGKFKRSKR